MSDRTVHALLGSNGAVLVRYDRAGKWYVEHLSKSVTQRRAVTLAEAVALASFPTSKPFFGLPGGRQFDKRLRERLAAQS